MSRTGTVKSPSVLGSRREQSTASRLGTTKLGSTQRTRSGSHLGSECVTATQIQEIKLSTQKIREQITLHRSQLKRMKVKINATTSAINKTFEQSAEKPQASATIHANTISNLEKNVYGARNTLDSLSWRLEASRNDDRASVVEELEEELKMTYCEYRRLCQEVAEREHEANFYMKRLQDAEYRASGAHMNELKANIRDVRNENASLLDKANAYQLKNEKTDMESEIVRAQQKKVSHQKMMEQINARHQSRENQMKSLCDEMNEEQEQHERKVSELLEIIEEMTRKMTAKLKDGPNGE